MPTITIIIPYYQTPVSSFTKCIDSLNALARKEDFKVLIVDDGSPTPLELTLYNPQFQYVILRYEENKGPGAARQLGIVHCDTEYLMFLDADDWFLHPHALDEYLEKIEHYHPDVLEPELAYLTPGGEPGNTKEAIWGHCYKRDFLVQNNIGFVELYYSEDFLFKTLVDWYSPVKVSIETLSYARGTLDTESLTRTSLSMAYFCEAAAMIYVTDFFDYNDLDVSRAESAFSRSIKSILNSDTKTEYYIFNILALIYTYSCIKHKLPGLQVLLPVVDNPNYIKLLKEVCIMIVQDDAELTESNPRMAEHIISAYNRAEDIYLKHLNDQ